jgi:hypothetical protein
VARVGSCDEVPSKLGVIISDDLEKVAEPARRPPPPGSQKGPPPPPSSRSVLPGGPSSPPAPKVGVGFPALREEGEGETPGLLGGESGQTSVGREGNEEADESGVAREVSVAVFDREVEVRPRAQAIIRHIYKRIFMTRITMLRRCRTPRVCQRR